MVHRFSKLRATLGSKIGRSNGLLGERRCIPRAPRASSSIAPAAAVKLPPVAIDTKPKSRKIIVIVIVLLGEHSKCGTKKKFEAAGGGWGGGGRRRSGAGGDVQEGALFIWL